MDSLVKRMQQLHPEQNLNELSILGFKVAPNRSVNRPNRTVGTEPKKEPNRKRNRTGRRTAVNRNWNRKWFLRIGGMLWSREQCVLGTCAWHVSCKIPKLLDGLPLGTASGIPFSASCSRPGCRSLPPGNRITFSLFGQLQPARLQGLIRWAPCSRLHIEGSTSLSAPHWGFHIDDFYNRTQEKVFHIGSSTALWAPHWGVPNFCQLHIGGSTLGTFTRKLTSLFHIGGSASLWSPHRGIPHLYLLHIGGFLSWPWSAKY